MTITNFVCLQNNINNNACFTFIVFIVYFCIILLQTFLNTFIKAFLKIL